MRRTRTVTRPIGGGLQAGALRAAGIGFDHAFQQEEPIFDLTAEAHLRSRLVGPLFAAVGLGLVVPVRRDAFEVFMPPEPLFRMSPVAGTAEAALGLAFL
jgi:hypothetical protein